MKNVRDGGPIKGYDPTERRPVWGCGDLTLDIFRLQFSGIVKRHGYLVVCDELNRKLSFSLTLQFFRLGE